MSDENQTTEGAENAEGPIADELELLKQRATQMGIKFSGNIGVESLRQRINAYLNDEPAEEDETEKQAVKNDAASRRAAIQKENMKLIRVRITNMNPSKRDLHGEIYTVANKYLGIVKKFIPYGEATEDGYHIPNVLYKNLKDRKFLQIKTKRNKATGQIEVEQRMVPEFSLEVLPPLTEKELQQLANRQAAAQGLAST